MTMPATFAAAMLTASALVGCGSGLEPGQPSTKGKVSGTMTFVLGGTAGSTASPATAARSDGLWRGAVQAGPLVAGDQYIVSPRKAKITFTSVTFRGSTGETLGVSDFTDCTATYDRALPSGSTLLDCPMTVPVGDIFQIAVGFNKTLQLLVSDPTAGIYSDPSSATGYAAAAPAAGAAYVPFTIVIGDNSPTRAPPILFASPVSISVSSTPKLFITTDMIQTFQLTVNAGGTTLSPVPVGNDPVALFGGLSRGTSAFYSNANAVESYKVGSVNEFTSLRIFYDQAGIPLFAMSPNTCGIEGPKGAWASPPVGATIGGWLGRDANRTVAWALPLTSSYATYSAYFLMAEQSTLGQTTTLKCKATTAPPAPADGKTYASGAPAMPSPDKSTTLKLLAK